jgi:hypothetical protein
VAEAGFDAMFVSGYCVAGALLGVPDIGLLSQTGMADVAHRVCAAVPDRLVVVGADTGYGNPASTVRTVERGEQAGRPGCSSRPGLPEALRAHGRQGGRPAPSGWPSCAALDARLRCT